MAELKWVSQVRIKQEKGRFLEESSSSIESKVRLSHLGQSTRFQLSERDHQVQQQENTQEWNSQPFQTHQGALRRASHSMAETSNDTEVPTRI